MVDLLELLQLGLDTVGDILLDFAGRRARIEGRDRRHLDGKIRVLQLPQLEEGADTRRHQNKQREDGQRAIADRQFRQVHDGLTVQRSWMRTAWPSWRLWTPAVTMRSPGFSPSL